jgi:hypothetical protein
MAEQDNTESAQNTQPYKPSLTPEMEARKWKPGECGNPGGRPKKKPVTELYEQILSDPANLALVEKAIVKALSRGQMAMVLQLKEMTDRVEGKVTQPIEADVTVNLADAIAEARKRAGR